MTTKYFLISASRDYVLKAIKGGFAQSGHGRLDNISKFTKGDLIIYYIVKDKIDGKSPYQKFTALGQVSDDKLYQTDNNPAFKPYRRDVVHRKTEEANIRPLLERLDFIKNKQR